MGADKKVTEAAKKRSEAIAGAGGEYQSAIDKANTDYQESIGKTVTDTETEVNKANTDFASIVQGYKDELKRAELEDKKQQEIDQKTVAWTGATELAAAIANMVGVGSFGASNQQHHSFSQDWMKKADADAKLRQQRIDNIRERQRAMQQQGINLRLQGLGMLNRARGDAASAAYKGALDSAGVAYKTANAVAESDFNGVQQAASIGLQEQAKNISAAAQRSAQELQEFAHGAKRDENGKLVADPTSPYYIKNTDKDNKSGGFSYDATINGVNYKLSMSKETFERAIKDGKAELKQDLVKMLGVTSWETLVEDAAQKKDKKKKFLEYAPVINALNSNSTIGGDDSNNSIIDSFVQLHRSELNNFNTHLLRVSSSVQDRGPAAQTSPAPAQSEQTPAPTAPNGSWTNIPRFGVTDETQAGQAPAGENKDERNVSALDDLLNS